MFVIHIETKQIKSFHELKMEYPHVSFAYTNDGLTDFGYAVLNDTAIPPLKPFEEAESYIEEENGNFTRKYRIFRKQFATQEALSSFLSSLKREKKLAISQIRYEKEIEGIEFNGIRIGTDREDKGMLLGALMTLQRNGGTIRYKAKNGNFIDLDINTLGQIYDLVSSHTQTLFNKEADHFSAIDNLPDDAEIIYDYNVNSNW